MGSRRPWIAAVGLAILLGGVIGSGVSTGWIGDGIDGLRDSDDESNILAVATIWLAALFIVSLVLAWAYSGYRQTVASTFAAIAIAAGVFGLATGAAWAMSVPENYTPTARWIARLDDDESEPKPPPPPPPPRCDPAYKNKCLDPNVDYDCADGDGYPPKVTGPVYLRNPSNDPSGLDGYNYVDDGVGCE